ncbi:MAG: 1,4-dihydroxy-2-naphthoate octaprenyltransferase [Candidatus Hermodarchaeota archaeon]
MPEKDENRLSKARVWIRELRLPFTTASIVPIILGTAIAWGTTGFFLWDVFLLTFLGGICIHLGANVANDYWDYHQGSDNINIEYIRPFTGGSRMIQEGLLSPRAVLAGSIIIFCIGAIIGIYLTITRGYFILILGLLGIFFAFFYTAPPFKFVSRGVGEIIIGICFGVFLTLGAFFTQAQIIAWEPFVVSLPIALLVSGILYINEFADFTADRDAGKHTLVVRLGRKRASKLYFALLVLVYLIVVFAALLRFTNSFSLIVFSTIPLSILGARYVLKECNNPMAMIPANVSTILNHLITGITLTLAYVFFGLSIFLTPQLILQVVVVAGILGFIINALISWRIHRHAKAMKSKR